MHGTGSINLDEAGKGREHFAELLSDIDRICGEGVGLLFFSAFGGQCVTIPRRPTANSPLAKAIGAREAELLASEYAGERIDVPMGSFSPHNVRGARMRAMVLQRLSPKEIAKQLNCGERTVRRARQRLREQGLLP